MGNWKPEGKEFGVKIGMIALLATVYHTCLQRNARVHNGKIMTEDVLMGIRINCLTH